MRHQSKPLPLTGTALSPPPPLSARLEAILLSLIEQIRFGRAQIDDLWTPIPLHASQTLATDIEGYSDAKLYVRLGHGACGQILKNADLADAIDMSCVTTETLTLERVK
jgi:hypothetical protein